MQQGNTLFNQARYPLLYSTTHLLAYNNNPLLGMDDTLESIRAGMHKEEMSNILLIAEAGGGKTATVQEFAKRYADQYIVLETSVAQMENGGADYLAKNFKELFAELSAYRHMENQQKQLVLFIDEFHQLPLASHASVEALKPEFSRSGQLGIHVIGATTYDEYHQYIEDNMALRERFTNINLPIANNELTFKILKSRIKKNRHWVRETAETDHLLKEIVFYTDMYIKDRVQPRKSTDLLDDMISWVKIGKDFNHKLLAKVLYRSTNIRIDLQFDARGLKDYLNHRVFNQKEAVNRIVGNAYSSILGVNDPTKPRGVYLFVGSTGVGKTELAKQFTYGMFGENAHMVNFDMAEYQNDDDVELFQHRLTDVMLQANTPVILLDEIEKANPGIDTLLYLPFDEARLSDRNGRPVNFANVFFLLTTNQGEEVFNDISTQGLDNEKMQHELAKFDRLIFRALTNSRKFPTALLGRLTGFIPFAPMTDETNKLIAKRNLNKLAKAFMNKQNIKIRYDMDNILRFVTKEKLDTNAFAGGARQIKNIINKDITDKLSEYVIFHQGQYDLYVTTEGQARTLDKHQLTSYEHIKVSPTPQEIINTSYKNARIKYKGEIYNLFTNLTKKGLQLSFNQDELFKGLARNDRGQTITENMQEFFAPLNDYEEMREAYRIDPRSQLSRPSDRIKLTIENGELIINQL